VSCVLSEEEISFCSLIEDDIGISLSKNDDEPICSANEFHVLSNFRGCEITSPIFDFRVSSEF